MVIIYQEAVSQMTYILFQILIAIFQILSYYPYFAEAAKIK